MRGRGEQADRDEHRRHNMEMAAKYLLVEHAQKVSKFRSNTAVEHAQPLF